MIASGFEGTCSSDAARFDHDKRICNACLATDFSATPITEFKKAMTRYVFNLSCLIAFIPVLLILRHYRVRGWMLIAGFIVLVVAGGAVCALLFKAGENIYLFVGHRRFVREKPKEALLEAERFYYLALWAALTRRKGFARTMLRQAERMGFIDKSRLHDPTLESVAT